MLPDKIGGHDDEHKPGILIAVGSLKKPKVPEKIGGTGDEPEGEEESVSNSQAMKDAANEALSAVKRSDADGFAEAMKAFFYACDAEPHSEGEHTEEEGNE